MNKTHTVYLIGGPMRVGKTIIGTKMLRRAPLVVISTDGIRWANRSLLFGMPDADVRDIRFTAHAKMIRKGKGKDRPVSLKRSDLNQDELAWKSAIGFIEAYDRANRIDLLIEGVAVTPERVHRLKLRNLSLRAAFVGYSNESHAAAILAHADRKKERDWVYQWIKEGNARAEVKGWTRSGIAESRVFRKDAERFGYGYFDLSVCSFREHVRAVIGYLTE